MQWKQWRNKLRCEVTGPDRWSLQRYQGQMSSSVHWPTGSHHGSLGYSLLSFQDPNNKSHSLPHLEQLLLSPLFLNTFQHPRPQNLLPWHGSVKLRPPEAESETGIHVHKTYSGCILQDTWKGKREAEKVDRGAEKEYDLSWGPAPAQWGAQEYKLHCRVGPALRQILLSVSHCLWAVLGGGL